MSKVYTIYLRTNLVNGKQYVGQTKDIKQRDRSWHSLKERYCNSILDYDREKYGLENWTSETLADAETQEESWELEKRFIKQLNTKYPNGYNISDGGAGATGVAPWHKGKHLSEETRKKISIARIGEGNGMFGKEPWNKGKHYEGKKCRTSIFEYDFDGNLVKKWNSLDEIENELNISHTGICQCASGRIPSIKGRIWSYIELSKEEISAINEKRIAGKSHRAKKVNHYNDEGELIATYNSVTEASEKVGVSKQTIINLIKSKNKSRKKNMHFKYV